MKSILYFIMLVALLSLIALAPLAVVWSINTLFLLNIPYTFWTWLAVVVLNLTWFYKPQLKKGN